MLTDYLLLRSALPVVTFRMRSIVLVKVHFSESKKKTTTFPLTTAYIFKIKQQGFNQVISTREL